MNSTMERSNLDSGTVEINIPVSFQLDSPNTMCSVTYTSTSRKVWVPFNTAGSIRRMVILYAT